MKNAVDPSRYTRVRDRVRAFYRRFPTGSIRTELVRLADDLVVFKALAYRDPHDPHPTTGWAYERPAPSEVADHGEADHDELVARCERAAVGRALANRDFAGPRRPSWEEMEKVRRMSAWLDRHRPGWTRRP